MDASKEPQARDGSRAARRAVVRLGDHPVVDAGARAGYAVNGLLHLLIAFLGLQVAFGHTGADADPAGAMALVAATPVGGVVLVAVVLSFGLLAFWQVTQGVRSHEASGRVKAFAKAVTYLALAWGAGSILAGSARSGSTQAKDATSTLLSLPFGTVLVGAAGLAVLGIGAYHVHKGWTQGFRADLESAPSRPTIVAGQAGYIAKGIALLAVGAGLVTAAALHDPSQSRGLDGALGDLVGLPFGQVLVAAIALGFATYGLYSLVRARRAQT